MGKKTSIWIMSVLFGLGIIAAYHSDSKRVKAAQANYQTAERSGTFTVR